MDDRFWKVAKELGYLESEIRNRAKKEELERHQRETERNLTELRTDEAQRRKEEIEAAYILGQSEAEKRAKELITENDERKSKAFWRALGWIFGVLLSGALAIALNAARLWDTLFK